MGEERRVDPLKYFFAIITATRSGAAVLAAKCLLQPTSVNAKSTTTPYLLRLATEAFFKILPL